MKTNYVSSVVASTDDSGTSYTITVSETGLHYRWYEDGPQQPESATVPESVGDALCGWLSGMKARPHE